MSSRAEHGWSHEHARWLLASLALQACSIDSRAVRTLEPGSPQFESANGNGGSADALPESGAISPAGAGGMPPRLPGAGMLPPGAAEPALGLEPALIEFGAVATGSSKPAILTVRNLGSSELAAPELSVSGAAASDFTLDAARCSSPLSAGAACEAVIAFAPSATGARSASVLVEASNAGSAEVSLTGEGLPPGALASSASTLVFPEGVAGEPGAVLEWTVTNTDSVSSGPLAIAVDSPDFTLVQGCPAPLPPGESCTLSAQFTPRLGGERVAYLSVESAEAGSIGVFLRGSSRIRVTVQTTGPGRIVGPGIDCGTTCSVLLDAPANFTLRPEVNAGSGAVFRGWTSAPACAFLPHCTTNALNRSTTVRASFGTLDNNLVFVSSEALSMNLGSARAYDAECDRLAANAGLIAAGSSGFIAALSDTNSSFRDRIASGVQGWVRADGRPFTSTIAELLDRGQLYHPLVLDEYGAPASGGPMTGFREDGTVVETCNDFRGTGTVTMGAYAGGPEAWSEDDNFGGLDCSQALLSIICLENRKTVPLVLQRQPGKLVWVTRGRYTPGATTPDEFCSAEAPAAVARARAVIAYEGTSYLDVFEPGTDYVRPDGMLVIEGSAPVKEFYMPGLTGIWLTADGTYLESDDPFVYLGAMNSLSGGIVPPARAGATCADWTDPSAPGRTGLGDYPSGGLRSYSESGCSSPHHLYCIEI